jgi:hypothetical protein
MIHLHWRFPRGSVVARHASAARVDRFVALYFGATTSTISAILERQLPIVAPLGDSSVPRVEPFADFGFISAFCAPDLSGSEVVPDAQPPQITRGNTHSIPSHCSTKDSDGLSSSA